MTETKFQVPAPPDGWVWEVTIVKTDYEDEYRAEVKAVETGTNNVVLQRIQFNMQYDSISAIQDLFLLAAEAVCKDITKQTPAGIFSEIVNAFNKA